MTDHQAAAVRAVAETLHGECIWIDHDLALGLAEAAVATAAPHLARAHKAEAWDEGFEAANEVAEGCHDCIGFAASLPPNPYREPDQ